MTQVFETENFVVEAPELPHVDRKDGGHLMIKPKKRIYNRQLLTPLQAIECMRLVAVVGEAMEIALQQQGIDVGRINYQDNGNWSVNKPEGPYFHIHLYGRAKSAVYHKWGHACRFPLREDEPEFYKNFKPLNSKDIAKICKQIGLLLKNKRYSNTAWKLK